MVYNDAFNNNNLYWLQTSLSKLQTAEQVHKGKCKHCLSKTGRDGGKAGACKRPLTSLRGKQTLCRDKVSNQTLTF